MSSLLGPGGQKLAPAAVRPGSPAPAAANGGDPAVVETTTRTFVRDVIEASRQAVVLVDFWAPWCGPCKQLTPILEKTVKAFHPAVRLVTMNIDDHPEIAGQLGIRSIPAVYAFRNGQPVSGFVGVQTEAQVRTFLERIAGPATDGIAELVAEGDAARAERDFDRATLAYGEALQRDPENLAAIAGLGMVSVASGDLDGARDLLAQLPDDMKREGPIQALDAALKLAEQASALGGTGKLRRAVEADPADVQARFDLAVALAAEGDRAEAVSELVELMRRDREWNEGAAQKQLIQFFEAWGPADPATLAGRRKMASVLFA